MTDFEKYAISNGIGSNKLDAYGKYVAKNLRSDPANHIMKNGYINPVILEEREMNVVAVDVISRLSYDRILYLTGAIDTDVAKIINAEMLYLNSIGEDDVRLFISSGGGSVIDGLSIYDVMNFIQPDVATYCVGMCASMASVLLSSGEKGKRYSLPHGEVMIHQVSGMADGSFADMNIAVKHAGRLQETLYNILAENTGKSYSQIEKDADRDNWFNAQQALEYGLIDEITVKSK